MNNIIKLNKQLLLDFDTTRYLRFDFNSILYKKESLYSLKKDKSILIK